ncbi:hypothetical protein C0J52_01716 [Blattella germanica]|nr:hypothetical protein C0J52_01716 [Blattella germanica]
MSCYSPLFVIKINRHWSTEDSCKVVHEMSITTLHLLDVFYNLRNVEAYVLRLDSGQHKNSIYSKH